MILEGMVLGGLLFCGYTRITMDTREEKRYRKNIAKKWYNLMDNTVNSKRELNQDFELLKVIKKHYGWDAIVSIPSGKSTKDCKQLIPKISSLFNGQVMMIPQKNSVYLKVWSNGEEISFNDEVKFKWDQHFEKDEYRNSNGETYRLLESEEILSQMDNKEVIGYKYEVKIPNGLSYSVLENETVELGRIFGMCKINYDYKTKKTTCEILNKRLDDEAKFVPIKVKPWELYIGAEHNFTPIVLDYSKLANSMISGRVGTGKTVAMITGFINLILNCDPKEYELYIGMIGEKQDLAIFRNCKSTKYYAQDIKSMRKMMKYLQKEMNRRNKLFQSQEMCFNIFRYNNLVSDEEKLPIIHFICDEVADLMIDDGIQEMLWNLIRKSRSAGIYVTVASQRFSLANISSEIKAQLSNKIMFKMSNTASALTASSDLADEIVALPPSREFIADYQEGKAYGKTLELTEEDMVRLMKDKIEKDHQFLNISNEGNVITDEEVIDKKDIDDKDNKEAKKSRWVQMKKANEVDKKVEGEE